MEFLGLIVAGLTIDVATLGLAIVNAPSLLGELVTDVVAIRFDLRPELHEVFTDIATLTGDCRQLGLPAFADSGCHRRLLHLAVAADRAAHDAQLGLLLVGRIVGEPSLEDMVPGAPEVEQNHDRYTCTPYSRTATVSRLLMSC